MESPANYIPLLLLIGVVTSTSAANITCSSGSLNETALCANITNAISVTDQCKFPFQSFACSNSSTLTALPDDILATLSTCYNNTVRTLDPVYVSLFLSKLDANKTNSTYGKLRSQYASLSPEWRKFLLDGIWPQLIQKVNNSADPPQWIPSSLQPFFSQSNPDIVTCLQQQNATCGVFQELVKNLDLEFPNITNNRRQELYPALKLFLSNRLKVSGSACANINSSMWIKENFGTFSQFANISDFTELNPNFTALSALPLLTLQQIATFSIDINLSNKSDAVASIMASISNGGSVLDFLSAVNAAAILKNQSTLQAPLSQALLNKTFEVLKSNSSYSNLNWSQLFQENLTLVLTEITPEQLNLINQSIPCDSYQAIVASLNTKFPQMTPGTQKNVFRNFIQPYMKKNGPSCSKNDSSIALLKRNFGNFSAYADVSEIVSGLGDKFNLDVVPSLSLPQLVSFSLNTTMNVPTANSIVGTLQSPSDISNFFSIFNPAVLSNKTSVDPILSKALITKTFQIMQSNFSSFTSSNWTQLLEGQLGAVLPNINPDQLNQLPKNLSCDSYQAIVKAFDVSFSQMATETKQGVYNTFIKPYLTTKGNSNTVICYNKTDVNSSAWLVNNMASFSSIANEGDLKRFANETLLQAFVNDSSFVKLASKLNFSQSSGKYFTSLLTSSPNFTLSSLPSVFYCFLNPSVLNNANGQDALAISSNINKQCFSTPSGQTPPNPTPDQVTVAISLVNKLTNFSSETLNNLGQTAVGLSPGQINKITDNDLKSSVSTLANVKGWNTGQTRSIMDKLLKSNFSYANLTNLGSLVTGLPSQKLLDLDPKNVVSAVKDPQFASQLASAPPTLQNAVVKQIITADSNPSNFVKNIPGNLASFIPPSKLIYKSEKPALQDVNGKSWTPNQAAMFFNDVLSSTSNYSQMSASVLQGFTCDTPNKIDNNQLKTLAKAFKTQNAALSEAQLACLSRQVTKNGYPADLDQYPNEVFLYLNASTYANGSLSCKDFYAKVGAANVTVLPKGSKLRNSLLSQALTCLNVTGFNLTDANIQVLGQLTCDLNTSYIESASGSLLSNLTQCKSLTATQQKAILNVLSSGNSVYGLPSNWTSDTLNSLGGIVAYLNQSLIASIPSGDFNSWMKTAIQNSAFSRDQFASLVSLRLQKSSNRTRRETPTCPNGMQITAEKVTDDLLPLNYDTSSLDLCLDNDILLNYLTALSSKAFTNEQLQVLKNKLDAIYPGGYPDNVVSSLGAISFLCTPADISKWNITSVDTLGSLLASGPTDSLAQTIISRYITLANQLNGTALSAIGSKYICILNSNQLKLITPSALSDVQPLDVSACNQTVKDALYVSANASYQNMADQTSTYYNLIKPYLGGAPLADLKALASKSPNMDISTFASLNPSSVTGLTVSDVKNLLGNNTADLLTQSNNTTVSQWIQAQKQSDLDTLGLGILGGIRDVTTTATTVSTTVSTTKTSSSSPVFLQSLSFVLTAVGVIFLL
ncbi:mesothelin [Pyxicephalus adspersus]|uniref:mesothelin n=1 Tax=Pyxicephalus adspersus TaxID=30357 RepID=UPI003B5BEE32